MRSLMLLLCLACAHGGLSPAHAQTSPTSLHGVYVALRSSTPLSVPAEEYITFYADGRVYNDDPDEGMSSPLQWSEACRNTRCGSYAVRGKTVVIGWAGGGEQRFEIEQGGVLKPAGSVRRFRPLASLDGARLDGVYVLTGAGGEVMVGITFSSEGEFREYNLLPYTNWVMRGDAGERKRLVVPEGWGRYTIRRNTLELRYSDGLVARLMISVPPGVAVSGTPSTVRINRTSLARAR